MSDPVPSATVVVLRDGPGPGFELLLLERRQRERTSPPFWVFPGGKVEPDDARGTRSAGATARRAAVRESAEEAGLQLDPRSLVAFSRWITPLQVQRRFDTWYFATRIERSTEILVDGQEIESHRWLAPADGLRAQRAGELRLAPPTYVTLHWLAEFESIDSALEGLPAYGPEPFHVRIEHTEAGPCSLYPGDGAYAADAPDPRARHRLWMGRDGWRYERDPAPHRGSLGRAQARGSST